jgi:hypothetical protein
MGVEGWRDREKGRQEERKTRRQEDKKTRRQEEVITD